MSSAQPNVIDKKAYSIDKFAEGTASAARFITSSKVSVKPLSKWRLGRAG